MSGRGRTEIERGTAEGMRGEKPSEDGAAKHPGWIGGRGRDGGTTPTVEGPQGGWRKDGTSLRRRSRERIEPPYREQFTLRTQSIQLGSAMPPRPASTAIKAVHRVLTKLRSAQSIATVLKRTRSGTRSFLVRHTGKRGRTPNRLADTPADTFLGPAPAEREHEPGGTQEPDRPGCLDSCHGHGGTARGRRSQAGHDYNHVLPSDPRQARHNPSRRLPIG